MLRAQAQAARILPQSRPRRVRLARLSSTAALQATEHDDAIPLSSAPDVDTALDEGESEPPLGSDDPKTTSMRQCSAIVVVKGRLKSLADAYAVVRAVEQRFGALREYSFPRESGSLSQYSNRFFVVFKSRESQSRLPKSDAPTISIPAPLEDTFETKSGGPSFSDFRNLLAPADTSTDIPEFGSILDAATGEGVEGKSDEQKRRMINFTIFQARKDFYAPTPLHFGLGRGSREATGRAMLNWGGFYPMEPIVKGATLDYGVSTVDHVRMRRLLRKWSELTAAPNPFEVSPVNATPTSTPQEPSPESMPPQTTPATEVQIPTEWDPLPIKNTVVDDIPSLVSGLSAVEASPKVSLPQAPKHATRLRAKLRPSTTQSFGLDAEALLKASETIHFGEVSSRSDSTPERKREKKPKAPAKQSKKADESSFSNKLKSFLGSWF